MCKECGKQFCPSSCPEFSQALAGGGKSENVCFLCGEAIYPYELYYKKGKIRLCSVCESGLTLSELGVVCGINEGSPLSLCGFETVMGGEANDD
ncbi:MAG: hypothetical protein IJ011_05860 [Clostridia bacterium]|nr:hypothetical protein [Clostridia bacterium]